MQEMGLVDNRIMDSNLHASLQNGTAFYASTSLLAVGGALASAAGHRRRADDPLPRCPFNWVQAGWPGRSRSRASGDHLRVHVFQVRLVVPAVQLRRRFHRCGAAARAATIGRDPQAAAERAASMNVVAAHHFNRRPAGVLLRACLSGLVCQWLCADRLNACRSMLVMWRRQFASDALATLAERATLPLK